MSPIYSRALRALRGRRGVVLSTLIGGGVLALACSTGPDMLGTGGTGPGPGVGGSCDHPALGCACPTEGATAACGEVIRKAADYVTCSMGTRTCSGGMWGACVGDGTQQVKGAPIVSPGARPLDLQPTPTTCVNNPCDPECTEYTDNGTGLDAGGGLSITDAGGVTLAVQDGQANCTGLRCNLVACDGGVTTTVTGTIRDPAGVNPIYNAFVYVPNAALTPFTQGVTPDACGGGGNISGDPIVFTQTAADGTFTLTNVPVGNNIPVVIQIGHFRRKVIIPTVSACTNNVLSLANSTLPKNGSEGELPYFAIASGGCDPLECLLKRIGIDQAEFTQPAGSGHVAFYQASGGMPLAAGVVPWYDSLVGNLATLKKYDLIFLPCQCGSEYGNPPAGSHDALRDYTTAGGRIFTSHWGREWIENTPNVVFPGVANWNGAIWGAADPVNVHADQGSAKGVAFHQWLLASGATDPFAMTPSRYDVRTVTAPTLSLAYAFSDNNTGHGTPDNIADMSFNTPLGLPANQQVGRVVFADTHASAAALGGGAHQFPDWCSNTALDPQERALEFMIFDLSACVQPFVPPPYQTPVTYLRDYEGVCPAGKAPVWHFFDWQTVTPKDSSLAFTVQTADTQLTLQAAPLATLATVSGAPVVTWTGADVATALTTIPSNSKAWLRVNITLNPSSDQLSAPTLVAWRQAYDCVDNL